MSELDQVLEQIRSKYDIEIVPLKIADKTLNVVQIKDYDEYLEKLVDSGEVAIMDLPFWAKVWEATFLLAYFLGKQPVVPGRQILEVGAGVGVLGVYAALCGHDVIISDINEDALLFSQANVLLNNADKAVVKRIDWNDSEIPVPYDVIVGSEIIYDRPSYPLLVGFLRKALSSDGLIFLAKSTELDTPMFFRELTQYFELKQKTQVVRSGEEEQAIDLFAIRKKKDAPAEA
ncbi:MAG: class I SAM-dependent methyltransferase [Acidobacteriota bacterium]